MRFRLPDNDALVSARKVAVLAAGHAGEADRNAEFPADAVSALAGNRLLAAVVPETAGGLGLGLSVLAQVATELARGCGSTAMIWAMHQIMLACAVRHGGPADVVSTVVSGNQLLASVTSEKGMGAELSRANAAIHNGRSLEKEALTVSYGEHAGAFLILARRAPDAEPDDIVAVVVRRDQVELTRTGTWNPMGMRGTCSPPLRIKAEFEPGQVLGDPFRTVKSRTLVPMSQILWSAVWIGLATEALDRAAKAVDTRGKRSGTTVLDHRMAWGDQLLLGLETQLADAVRWCEEVWAGQRIPGRRFAARLNALKLAASTNAVTIAQQAMAMCGFPGYQEDGPLSIARILRDLYSAQVMVSNDRLLDANAATALTGRLTYPE
ncbi:acyl-CoA dehydrogenase family protein [Actinocrispum sp. NPDC049592]|uniref:acyl-CoA dehydrogenase family protein n=1 Tax=Actinocrispum sp. NPDC049592 TaxID=3154835 RepID=UPI00341CFDCC